MISIPKKNPKPPLLNLFKKSPKPLPDYSALGVDLHSHLIPGIDDGAQDMEDSIILIRALRRLGFRKLITTPHIMSDHYPNTPETILSGLREVKAAIAAEGIDIELQAAAEYMLDENFGEKIEAGLLTVAGKQVLVEMGFFAAPPQLYDYLFTLQTKGYQPILAHPERYTFLNQEDYQKLKDHGCAFQLNLLSLTGHYGKPIKDTALKLLKAGMIDYLATDLHHEGHADELQQALGNRTVIKVLEEYAFLNGGLG